MLEMNWEKMGDFFISRLRLAFAIKLNYFDDEFKEFARAARGKWDPLNKAWIIPSAKEQEAISYITEYNKKKELLRAEIAANTKSKLESLTPEQFEYDSDKIKIKYSSELQKFTAQFPFDENKSRELRNLGAKWSTELKAYIVPITATEWLESLVRLPKMEKEQFQQRNLSFCTIEKENPINEMLTANEKKLSIKIEFIADKLIYKITLPIPIESILGRELIMPALENEGLFGSANPAGKCNGYPKINQSSCYFEACTREKIIAALKTIEANIERLGHLETVKIDTSELNGRRWSRRIDPISGELLFHLHKSWLIVKATRSKDACVYRVKALSATQADERLNIVDATAKRRICDMSGIDFLGFDAYFEAIKIRESSSLPISQDGPLKKIRL